MENIEKYIFDPKDPKKCKVYNLLLQIVKDGDFLTMLSPLFYLQLFEKKVEKKIREELWDMPDDYDSLSFDNKIEYYFKQNSVADLFKVNWSNGKEIVSFCNFFPKITDDRYEYGYGITNDFSGEYEYYKYLEFKNGFYNKSISEIITEPTFEKDFVNNYIESIIFFVDKYTPNRTLIRSSHRSIACMTIEEFEVWETHNGNTSKSINNIHPLILQKRSDFNLLLDILQRDLQTKTNLITISSDSIHYLDNINIAKYFCIENLSIENLKEQKEIYILGENGDGKTLLLQSIILALRGVANGVVKDYLDNSSETPEIEISFEDGSTSSFEANLQNEDLLSQSIYAYGVSRNQNDSDKKDKSGYLTLFSSEQYLNNPVKWLQYLDYKRAKGETDGLSIELAIEMLTNILNDNIEIEVQTDEVLFKERGTSVRFDQLAEGYKSVLIWVCDLIQRLSESQPDVYELNQYKGTVLVDEIGLHLHPKWEYQIVRKLRSWFPNIQFIFTTHSPTVILGSSPDAVFYKLYKENGITKVSKPVNSIKNLMANGVLTSPLFNNDVASAFGSNPEELDTNDDFLYTKIHTAISERVRGRNNITELDIQNMVAEALDQNNYYSKGAE